MTDETPHAVAMRYLTRDINDTRDDIRKLADKVDVLADHVTEAITRLDHPDPMSCTQQQQIAEMQANQVEIFRRLNEVEKFHARLQAIVVIVSTMLTIAMSWVGTKIYEAWHHVPKGAIK